MMRERELRARAPLSLFDEQRLRARVEALEADLAAAEAERDLLEQERDAALLRIEELESRV